ncbi:hypothetical protein QWL27_28190 [Streptomyces thermocarboxydus]|uniref:hypothetical protein n=1 Tax=Streptomyces TaxID=1883 RepID=UPI0025CAEBF1|nr:hypothetical protein [Streptomyces thermocarboxydus]
MRSLIVNVVLVVAVFALVLLALGSGMGGMEITIWFGALLASLVFVISRYVRQRGARTEAPR